MRHPPRLIAQPSKAKRCANKRFSLLSASSLQRCHQWHNSQAPPSLKSWTGRCDDRRRQALSPLSKYTLHILRDAFKNHRGDGNIRPILHSCSKDAIFLCEHERIVEGRVLRLSFGSHNNIDLKESVQHIDIGRRDIGLTEWADFDDLEWCQFE